MHQPHRLQPLLITLAILLASSLALAQPAQPGQPGTYQHMDYGPVIGQSITAPWPDENTALKGLAIRLDHDSAMIFDKDLLRFSAATADGWVDILNTDYAAAKGHGIGATEGRLVFATAPQPGWAHPETGSFDDTRHPAGIGNLPRDHAHYEGYYRHGDRIVLSYTVGDTNVLEMPQAVEVDGQLAFVRRMHVGASGQDHAAMLLKPREDDQVRQLDPHLVTIQNSERHVAVVVDRATRDDVELAATDAGVELRIAGRDEPREIHVAIIQLDAPQLDGNAQVIPENLNLDSIDLPALTEGGPAQWDEPVVVEGQLGNEDAWAYTVDTLTLPAQNPWNARMRLMGFDFFAGGERAAILTLNGDVWTVDGIDGDLSELRWRRYASGLFEPGGLTIVDDTIYVLERGQITRLTDLNNDGEADFYENFNNDQHVHPRAFWLTLETDSEGAFYFIKNGNRVPADVPDHGALIRVSPDGEKAEIYATGLRSANGLHLTDDDLIMIADQEGEWTPSTRVNIIEQGGFYGFRRHGGQDKPIGQYELPVCWIPHVVDNSSGDAALAPDDGRFGPLSGHWLHTSYGKAKLFALMFEQVDGVEQGGVVELPLFFESGIMRARFNDRDGQLYITGMRGWQTVSFRDGAFYRVRYTGGPANLPVAIHAREQGVTLTFTDPLDPDSATDPDNFTAKRWTYLYTAAYGSGEVSLKTPAELRAPARSPAGESDGVIFDRDAIEITNVTLSDDRRTVHLEIPDIHPVEQMMIRYNLQSDDGASLSNAVYHTVHQLAD